MLAAVVPVLMLDEPDKLPLIVMMALLVLSVKEPLKVIVPP